MKKLDIFEFKKKVDDNKPFIVKFKSDDCPICVELEPDYKAVSMNFPNMEFFDVDVDEEEDLADLFIHDGVPTLYYINGDSFVELDYPQDGFDKKSLTTTINKILEESK